MKRLANVLWLLGTGVACLAATLFLIPPHDGREKNERADQVQMARVENWKSK